MRAAVALAVALAAGCGGPWLPKATETDAARAQARWPGTTAEELNHGRSALLKRCSNCHLTPSPADRAAAEWPAEVGEMAERAGLQTGEGELITRYLEAFARDQVTRP